MGCGSKELWIERVVCRVEYNACLQIYKPCEHFILTLNQCWLNGVVQR